MASVRSFGVVFSFTIVAALVLLTCDVSLFDFDSESVMKGVADTHRFILDLHNKILADDSEDRNSIKKLQSGTSILNTCKLWIHDPLSGGIQKVMKKNQNPLEKCNRSFKPMTELKNGVLTISEEAKNKTDKCEARIFYETYFFRCLTYKSERKNNVGPWSPLANRTFECDFVEAKCTLKNAIVELYIHSQIWELERNTTTSADTSDEEKPFQPDVYIIIIDSVSSTQARRSLPNTLAFLEKNMSGVNFHFLNKVGDNSRPNGYAMTLGWRIEGGDRSVTGGTPLPVSHDWDIVCHQTRDNDSIIYKEFMKKGYKSLHAEEYNGNFFTWPNCKGCINQPTTHYYRPFVLEWNTRTVKSYMNTKNCMEQYSMMLDYSEKFINSYGDDPKFLLYWTATLAHDDHNAVFHTDSYFEGFFRRNEAKLKNAFVFFMADHGTRLGSSRKTQLGAYEVNNPFMMVTVPGRLRTNKQLMKNLKTNSEKLLTQYDVHASWVDILKFAPKSNFKQWDHITIIDPNPQNATSFFRPLGKYSERNCNNIPTDSTYCLCQFDLGDVNNNEVREMFGHYFVDYINNMYEQHNVTDKCQPLTLKKVMSLKGFEPVKETNLYEVKFEVAPSGGTFRASALYNSPGNILKREGSLQRINEYKNQGDCVKDIYPALRPYCYCKN